jgi:tetratricopeptide (TPR) repeat protein
MRVNCNRFRPAARLAKAITLILIVEMLSGMCLRTRAQILTKEDLQRNINVYEAASRQATIPNMTAIQAGEIWSQLGTLYQDAGRYGESEHAYAHAVRLLSMAPVSNAELASATDNLGTLHMEMGKLKEAEGEEERALKMREEAGLKTELPRSWYHLAAVSLREHRPEEARELAKRAADAFSGEKDAVPEDKIGCLLVLASSLYQTHQYPEAIARLQSTLQVAKETYGPDAFPTGLSEFLLGYAFWKSGDLSSATMFLQSGTKILEKELGWEHPAYLSVMTEYARFLRDDHQRDVARAIEERVKSTRAQLNSNPDYGREQGTIDVTALF